MSAPSPAFLRWWQAWRAAIRARVGAARSPAGYRRWTIACDELVRVAGDVDPEEYALVESVQLFAYAVRERIDERARREAP